MFQLLRIPISDFFKILFIIIKKRIKLKIKPKEFNFLCYYDLLFKYNFKSYDKELFIINNDSSFIYLRKFPSTDVFVYNQVLVENSYAEIIFIANRFIKNKKLTIIDIGANIGLTSFYFLKEFDNFDIQIVSIEPYSDNFKLMQFNLEKNNFLRENVSLINKGIYNKPCFLEIDLNSLENGQWGIEFIEKSGFNEINTIEISDILKERNWNEIDILKIDIEGAERYLFNEFNYANSFLCKTNILAIEIHDKWEIRDKIYNIINQCGFVFYNSGELTIAIKGSIYKS